MKYKALTQEKGLVTLHALRNGDDFDETNLEVRGEGPDLPQKTVHELHKKLSALRKKFPEVIKVRDPAGGRYEREACVLVHETLPREDPQMLADYDFWTWLALQLRDIVEWRHGGEGGEAHVNNFGIGGRRDDNLFYRMWVRAEIGRNENKIGDYDLAKRGDQDFWRSHVIRQGYGKCRKVVHAFVKEQFSGRREKPRWNNLEVRELAKRLRRVNATLIFESLDEGGAKQLIKREAGALTAGTPA